MTPSHLHLTRDCQAIQIPLGQPCTLPAGTPIHLTQSLGGSFTVQAPTLGGLYRIHGDDADALGLERPEPQSGPRSVPGSVDEDRLWDALRSCYDPEIPVNIVDLGLVYDLRVDSGPAGASVSVKMTLTAPGCGMGGAIAADARGKLESVPGVAAADVQVVWDPPWNAEMMTEAGKRQLGIPV